MVFTGDPGQLEPVRPSALSTPEDLLLAAEKAGRKVWNDILLYFELKQQNRGTADQQWYDMLSRVRNGKATENDLDLINTRVSQQFNIHDNNQVYIAFRNRDVDAANEAALAELHQPVLHIHACHEFKLRTTNNEAIDADKIELLHEQARSLSTSRNHLAPQLNVAIGAKIVLTTNIEQQAGLCNGSSGTVYDIMLDDPERLPILLVKIDSYTGPSFLADAAGIVPITSQTAALAVDKKCRYNISRTALPVRLGFATTIHKIQGRTCSHVIFNPTAINSSALTYVALPRVRNRHDIVLTTPVTAKHLEKTQRMMTMSQGDLSRIQPLLPASYDLARRVLPAMQLITTTHNLEASLIPTSHSTTHFR